MAIRVPVYSRQVGELNIPNYRARAAAPDLGPLARGIQQFAGGVTEAIQTKLDRNDEAALQHIKAQAAELRLQHEKDLGEKHGLEVFNTASSSQEKLREQLDKLGEGLSPRLQAHWMKIRDSEALGFKSSVNNRVVGEGHKMEDASFLANVNANAKKAGVVFRDTPADAGSEQIQMSQYKELVDDAKKIVELRAQHHKMPDDVRSELMRKTLNQLHASAIDTQIKRDDWRGADKLLSSVQNEMDPSTVGDFTKIIKAKRIEETAELESTKILQANKFDLQKSLDDVEKRSFNTDELKAVRNAVAQKFQLHSAALREADKGSMGVLVEGIWKNGIDPYSPRMAQYYNPLQPERKQMLAKEWASYKRSLRTARTNARRELNELEARKKWEYQAMLLDPRIEAPDPTDPTEPFFAGTSSTFRAHMGYLNTQAGRLSTDEKQWIEGRLQDYVQSQELDTNAEKILRKEVSAAVTAHYQATGGFKKEDLAAIVEPILLRAKRADLLSLPFRDEDAIAAEEAARLAEAHFAPQRVPLPTDEGTLRQLREAAASKTFGKAIDKLTKEELSQVTDEQIQRVWDAFQARGKGK